MEKQRPWRRRPAPPGTLDWSIQGTRGEATEDWTTHISRPQDWNIQGCHGEGKGVRKETTAAVSPTVEYLGRRGGSDPRWDH